VNLDSYKLAAPKKPGSLSFEFFLKEPAEFRKERPANHRVL
jgi:hypothetical protein